MPTSKRSLKAKLVLAGAVPALLLSTPAQATQSAEATYRALTEQAATRAGDPSFDYALAVAAIDSGRPGEAIVALQRVLAVQPGNAQARAELARAYAMAGDIDTAKAQFDTVLDDPTLPDPVRRRFTGLVRDYDRMIGGGGTDLSGFVEVSGGFDSNVNSATELTSIVIPLFAGLGAGTLAGNARAIDDGFGEALAGASVVSAVGRQDRVFASMLGSWRENFDAEDFAQQSLTGTAGYSHSFANRDVVSFSLQAQQFWLGHDSYRQAYGAIAQYTHLLDGGDAVSLSGQVYRFNYEGDPLRDADRYALAASYAGRHWVASVIGGHEETRRAAGDVNSNSFVGADLGFELPAGQGLAFVGGAAFDLRRYDREDVLFLTRRNDERLDVNAGVKLLIADNIYLRPRVTYTRNWSNIALYDFDRWTAGVGVRAEF